MITRTPAFALLFALAACGGASKPTLVLPPQTPALGSGEPTIRVADAALAGGAPAMALQVADGILAHKPSDVDALLRKGDALYQLKRYDESEANFIHVLKISAGNEEALLGLGRVKLAEDPAAAAKLFSDIVAKDRANAAAQNDLGIARDLLGEHAAAQTAYRAALALKPDMLAARVNLGVSLALSGQEKEALDVLRPLANTPDMIPRVRQDLAATLALAGQDAPARQLLSKDLDPTEVSEAMSGLARLSPGGF
jgi:Flp pilus assembly protein TadD